MQRSSSMLRAILTPLLYILLLLVGFEAYHSISERVPRQQAAAHHHAAALVAVERRLGIFLEPEVQRLTGANGAGTAISRAATLVYTQGQIPWLAAMLCWLCIYHRRAFRVLCSAAIVTTIAAILFAATYPVAPPRFALAGPPYWIADRTGAPVAERTLVQRVGFNPYASLPSIHVLWALITGLGLWTVAPRRLFRCAAVVLPCMVIASVVITGNHYLTDCFASAVLLGGYMLAYSGAAHIWRWTQARRRAAADHAAARGERGHPSRHRAALTVFADTPRPVADARGALMGPLLLSSCIGCLLVVGGSGLERTYGIVVFIVCAAIIVRGDQRTGSIRSTPSIDWLSGFLFVAGTTAIGAHLDLARELGSACWLAAALLPPLSRLGRHAIAIEPSSPAQGQLAAIEQQAS